MAKARFGIKESGTSKSIHSTPCDVQIVTLGNLIPEPQFLHLYKAQRMLAIIIAAINITDGKTEAREWKRQSQRGGGGSREPQC